MKIAGRTFVISGGASGLGQACAVDLVAHGGYVAVLDMNAENGAATVAKLGSDKARFFEVDVTSTQSIAAAVKGSVEWVGETGKPFGGVICAAGIGLPFLTLDKNRKPMDIESFDLVISINLRGTIDLARQMAVHMAASPPDQDGDRGVIIMISSSASFDGQMGQVAYAASKGALNSAALPMSRDLARHGIRTAVVAPGVFDTAMTAPMPPKVRAGLTRSMEFPKRAGRADEFALLARQLIENPMLNSAVIRIDGAARMPARI